VKSAAIILIGVAGISFAALAQTAPVKAPVPQKMPVVQKPAAPAAIPIDPNAPPPPLSAVPGTSLLLRGLDKITGRPTDIKAPLGQPVRFATLTIVARSCYSTPASETPETAAFVQIEDHRPDQPARRAFSGWMYGSSPGLHGMEHPLYDVWAISCSNNGVTAPLAALAAKPSKVLSPDSSDKEGMVKLPEEAGQ